MRLVELRRPYRRSRVILTPGKGNTLLNYCGIGTVFFDFTVDRNTYNHNLYIHGMHIPI